MPSFGSSWNAGRTPLRPHYGIVEPQNEDVRTEPDLFAGNTEGRPFLPKALLGLLRLLTKSTVYSPGALPFLSAARSVVRIPCHDWNLRIEPKSLGGRTWPLGFAQ